MKGDFSRWTFDPRKRFTAVLIQQGRQQVDSDWNEQAVMLEHLERTRFEDVVGSSAVPDGVGFEVCVGADGAPALSAGRIYAGGLLCELDADTPISRVARRALRPEPGRTYLVYLDAWERHVTAIDDPGLVEVALGVAETSTRLQVAWTIDFIEDVGDQGCAEATATMPKQGLARMTADAPNGYLGTENHLYRVEIHDSGALGEATFKWSRHNGSVLFPVERLAGPKSVRLGRSPVDPQTISVGDWLEIVGAEREQLGIAGMFARVEEWSESTREAVLDRDVSEQAAATRPRARQWSHTAGPTVSVEPSWIALEAGIRVRFAGYDFRNGDYWTFPARVASQTVEWPSEAPPQGVEHRLCPLALVTWDRAAVISRCRDCRRAFVPLTEMYAELNRLRAEVAELKSRVTTS
ncbi:MAG TPA: DUF6519 domain-containing protein [Gaiellaceae bacterium]|nr:DUF6519 domain-containing protein [Gaiellaceae bacterium]